MCLSNQVEIKVISQIYWVYPNGNIV